MEMYDAIDWVEDIGEGDILAVVSGVVESHNFWTFSVVHVFGVIVVLIEESLFNFIVELFHGFDGLV